MIKREKRWYFFIYFSCPFIVLIFFFLFFVFFCFPFVITVLLFFAFCLLLLFLFFSVSRLLLLFLFFSVSRLLLLFCFFLFLVCYYCFVFFLFLVCYYCFAFFCFPPFISVLFPFILFWVSRFELSEFYFDRRLFFCGKLLTTPRIFRVSGYIAATIFICRFRTAVEKIVCRHRIEQVF